MDNEELERILKEAEKNMEEAEEKYRGISEHRGIYEGIKAIYNQNKAILEMLNRLPSLKIDYEAIEEKLME